MSKVVILVAVENYASPIPPVKYAEADALDLGAAFESNGFAASDQTLLINFQATRTSIKSRVRKILSSLSDEDTFYLYYAGHGFAKNGKNFVTCVDTRLDDLEGTSIGVEWLFDQFKGTACKRIAIFLDSCESGMLANSSMRGIYTDLAEDELKTFFSDSEHCVCFAACKPGQSSFPSDKLKHGIWTYHLIEALNANAPGALERGGLLTSSSLQNYLKIQVPRTLRETLTGTQVQTPWVYGAVGGDFLIADVNPILELRKVAANPHSTQLKKVRLFSSRELSVRDLSGFQSSHRVPDRVSEATKSFIRTIADRDVNEDLDDVHERLREQFGFKRKEISIETADGGGSILTPYFDYEVTISLSSDEPSNVIYLREINNIRKPDMILAAEFDAVFDNTFDTLQFASGKEVDIASIVDQIEEIDDGGVSVNYDKYLRWCDIKVDGLLGHVRVTSRAISVIGSAKSSPRSLIESFFGVQKRLIDVHKLKQLPFGV